MSEGEAPSTIKHHSGMSLNQYLKEANDQINVLKSQVEYITRNNNDVEIQAINDDDTLGANDSTLFAERSKYNLDNPSKVSLAYTKPKKIRLLSVVTFNGSNIVKVHHKDNSLQQQSSKYKLPSATESQPQRKRVNNFNSLSPGGIFRGNALTIQKPQVPINKPLILQTPLTEVKFDEYYEIHRNRASQLQKRMKEEQYYRERLENKAIAYLDQVSDRVTKQQNSQVKNKNDNLKRLIEDGPPFLLTGPATIRNNEMKYMTINPNVNKAEIDEYPMVKKISSKKAMEQLNKLSAITRNSIYSPDVKTNQPKRADVIKLPNIYNYESLNFDFTEQHIVLSPKLNSPKNFQQPIKTNFANYIQNLEKPTSNYRGLSNPRPPNPQQNIIGPPHLRHKKTKSHLAHYNETSSLIVESLLLSEPDDMSKLSNGCRLDRTGFFSNFPFNN